MDVDVAASVLAGSILTGIALIVAVITVVIINNIISKYWKPIKWIRFEDVPPHIMSQEEYARSLESNTVVANSTVSSTTVQ
jgi:hypothetical protein